jgi:hypothetical protein
MRPRNNGSTTACSSVSKSEEEVEAGQCDAGDGSDFSHTSRVVRPAPIRPHATGRGVGAGAETLAEAKHLTLSST